MFATPKQHEAARVHSTTAAPVRWLRWRAPAQRCCYSPINGQGRRGVEVLPVQSDLKEIVRNAADDPWLRIL